MSEKRLESIRDLKEGMKVYVRDDLKDCIRYGDNVWVDDMIKGVIEFDGFNTEYEGRGYLYKDAYHYTNEMIDWDKTNELNCITKKERSNQDKKGENKMTKEEFFKKYADAKIRTVCYTEKISNEFLRLTEKFGVKWATGHKPTELNYFNKDIGKIYYTIEDNGNRAYLSKSNYSNPDYTEIEFNTAPESTQSNPVKLTQIKTVNSESDNNSLFGTFIQIGEEMVSYVEGNSVGTSYCHPDDQFNLEIGKALAYYRWAKGE